MALCFDLKRFDAIYFVQPEIQNIFAVSLSLFYITLEFKELFQS